MIDILNLAYFMIFAPLVCAGILLVLKFIPKKTPDYVYFILSTGFSLFPFTVAVLLFEYVLTYRHYVLEDNYPICVIQNIPLYFGIYTDALSVLFTLLSTALVLVANIFSYKYLKINRQGFARFYIYLNFLAFFLSGFFMSSNLIQSAAFMSALTLFGYLFANFYFSKPRAQTDSKKVFILDTTGDFILFGASAAFAFFSTLTPEAASIPTLGYNNINTLGLYSFASLNPFMYTFICTLFIIGALIKSSQFPFCSKSSLCSQAPNPAYSLLLSPVMLGAGIFLLYRLYPLLNLSQEVFEILKTAGIIGAIASACIALRENEIKQLCSWMAVSQFGIALCALGFKMYDVSVFYLLCAGFSTVLISYVLDSVSYSTGSQENIKFLGGLRKKLPFAAACFILGAISLCGLLFSGFYAKSMFLNNLVYQGSFVYPLFLLVFIFLTALYIFRIYFKVFEGSYRGSWEVQKTSRLMNFATATLCFPVIFFGFIFAKSIDGFLSFEHNAALLPDFFLNVAAFIAGIAGYYLAYNIYCKKRLRSLRFRPARRLAAEHFYMDYLIEFIFEAIPVHLSKILLFIEKYILTAFYLAGALILRIISYFKEKSETHSLTGQFFALIIWIFAASCILVIIYFKTGVEG